MASRQSFSPANAEFPTSAFPALLRDGQNNPYLAFDGTAEESCDFIFVAPQGLTGTLSLYLLLRAASATSGNTIFKAQVEAVSPGDSTDTDAASSFDTANVSSATAVPGTAGYLFSITITLTNADSMAAGDRVRIRLARDATNGSDTVNGTDIHVLNAEFRDSA